MIVYYYYTSEQISNIRLKCFSCSKEHFDEMEKDGINKTEFRVKILEYN